MRRYSLSKLALENANRSWRPSLGDNTLTFSPELRGRVGSVGINDDVTQVVFLSNRGTRGSYDALHYHWARVSQAAALVDEAGAPRYTPRQLCHTRGSELIAPGRRVAIVQRVLRQRDVRSTLGYAELQDAQVRAVLEGGAAR